MAEATGSGEVTIAGVTKRFGPTVAVENLDLTIPHGSYCCLLGPSGCGKTTILRMIAGHENPDQRRYPDRRRARCSACRRSGAARR